MSIDSLTDIDIKSLIPASGCHKSPVAWEDQVLYFLMLDRFSDGREQAFHDNNGALVTTGTTPLFQPGDAGDATGSAADAARWREAGTRYVGGTLNGLTSKIGYLKRLGVTAIWVSPVLEQVAFQDTYHGYGIRDYLQVNHRFGTEEGLKVLVKAAHEAGIYVILDIILNHSGDVFGYYPDRYPTPDGQGGTFLDPRWDGAPYTVAGFHDVSGQPTLPFRRTDPAVRAFYPPREGAIWPVEFQDPSLFTQKGHITNWDYDPEFREGDFFDLKDVHHGEGNEDDYRPSAALLGLAEVYKYWIAFADLDGFRIDTVKHMDRGATRFFASAIHEFAQSIGKDNFILIGEITGGRAFAFDTLGITGLDAALGIDDIPDKMEYLVKGYRNPDDYFSLFRNSELVDRGSHTWFRNKVVTLFDDHDQVRKGNNKARFCADPGADRLVVSALALNVLTLGIPCIYYGTEQGFDGHGGGDGADRYLREAMFGGEFGAFGSRNCHFFDEASPVYEALAALLKFRAGNRALTRGRQYLRPISGDGSTFGLPEMVGGRLRSVVAWSRILSDEEFLVAINTDPAGPQTAWISIDASLHRGGDILTCVHSTDVTQEGKTVQITARNGLSVQLTVPATGLVVFR